MRTRTHDETYGVWSAAVCLVAVPELWLAGRAPAQHQETRRIQLAARSGSTLAMLFRPISAFKRSSLAELRLALRPAACADHLSLDIIKRKGGWPIQGIELSLTQASQAPYDMMPACINNSPYGKKHSKHLCLGTSLAKPQNQNKRLSHRTGETSPASDTVVLCTKSCLVPYDTPIHQGEDIPDSTVRS